MHYADAINTIDVVAIVFVYPLMGWMSTVGSIIKKRNPFS